MLLLLLLVVVVVFSVAAVAAVAIAAVAATCRGCCLNMNNVNIRIISLLFVRKTNFANIRYFGDKI